MVARASCLVPERRRLYANLTVKENLMMGAYLRKDKEGIAADLEEMFQLFPIMRERISSSPAPFPAASSRCAPSPAGSCRARACCCWTSPPWAWRR